MENDQTAPNAAAASAPQTAQTAPQTGIPNLTDGLGAVLSNPELMAKLPQMMAMLRPMLEQQPAADSTTEAPPAAAQTAPAGPAVPAIATPQKKATGGPPCSWRSNRSSRMTAKTLSMPCSAFRRSGMSCAGCKGGRPCIPDTPTACPNTIAAAPFVPRRTTARPFRSPLPLPHRSRPHRHLPRRPANAGSRNRPNTLAATCSAVFSQASRAGWKATNCSCSG